MKKMIIITLAIFFLLLYTKIPVNAESSIPSWNFFPNGVNYLNPDYYIFEDNDGDFIFEDIEAFRVASNQAYTIISRDSGTAHLDLEIKTYNSSRSLIGNILPTKVNDAKYTFTVPSDVCFIKIDFFFFNSLIPSYNGVDDFFVLYESSKNISNLSYYDLFYKGPNSEYSFVTTEDIYYITNVNNPITIDEIEQNIKAYDNIDGDITNEIVFNFDEYVENYNVVGIHLVTATVKDSKNNTKVLNIYIAVCDYDAPVISGNSNISTNISSLITIDDIKNSLTISDNYDNLTKDDLVITNDNYSDNKNTVGTYQITFSLEDSSKNKTSFTVNITVIDDVKPVFTFTQDTITTGTKNVLSIDDIKRLSGLAAYDDISGVLTDEIYVHLNGYEKYKYTIGSWTIMFAVKDSANNVAYKNIQIIVNDDIEPVFAVNTQVFDLELGNTYSSPEDFVAVLVRLNVIETFDNIEVVYNDYSENIGKAGKYKMLLKVDGKELELLINVSDNKIEEKTPVKVNFFTRVGNFMVKVWTNVCAFFVMIWTKICSFFTAAWDSVSSFVSRVWKNIFH